MKILIISVLVCFCTSAFSQETPPVKLQMIAVENTITKTIKQYTANEQDSFTWYLNANGTYREIYFVDQDDPRKNSGSYSITGNILKFNFIDGTTKKFVIKKMDSNITKLITNDNRIIYLIRSGDMSGEN